MNKRPDERKEKKAGGVPPVAGAAGRSASLKAGGSLEGAPLINRPGLFSRFLGPGRSLSTLLRDVSLGRVSLTQAFSKAVHSPFAIGLLAGLTAISVGYGIVGTMKFLSKSKSGSSILGFPYTPSGPGVERRKSGSGDSLGMFQDANKGGLGDSLSQGLSDNKAEIPEEGTPEGDSASNMMDGKEKTDPNAMIAAMMEKAKNEGKDGKAGKASPGGASSGMMMSAGGGASAGGSGKSGDGASSGALRPLSGATRTSMGRSGASSHGVRGQTRAMGQLKVADQLSKGAATQSGESSNYTARQAFEGNSGAGGTPIDGPGGLQSTGGGPSTGRQDGVGTMAQPGMGDISGDEGGGEEEPPPEEVKGDNVTPYQQWLDLAQKLLMWAAILTALAFLIFQIAKTPTVMSAFWMGVAAKLSYLAAALAGIATLLGVGMMLFGQIDQGIMYTVLGALTTYLAYSAAENYDSAAATTQQELSAGKSSDGIHEKLLHVDKADIAKHKALEAEKALKPYKGMGDFKTPPEGMSKV
jgi:hypothetical protein